MLFYQGDEQLIAKLTNLDGINASNNLKEDQGTKRVEKLAEVWLRNLSGVVSVILYGLKWLE